MKKILLAVLLLISIASFGQLRKDQLGAINTRDIKCCGTVSSLKLGKLNDSTYLSLLGVKNNLLDLNSASAARINLGLGSFATLSSLSFSSLTGIPTTLSGYGITDGQPLNSNLTIIAGLTATTNNLIVSVGGAWASRTPSQVKTTLEITNTDISGLGSLAPLNSINNSNWSGTALADGNIASASIWNAKQNAITFGTGVQTALTVNIGSAGAFTTFGGAHGIPSSITLTNATGLPPTTGILGWPSNPGANRLLQIDASNNYSWVVSSGSGTVTNVASADGSVAITNPTTTPDLKVVKLNQGTAYTEVGTLLDDTFPGVTLSSTNWSGGTLPTGATVNNKLIIASGLNDWTRVIKLNKFYPFERETFEIYFKAVTKNSGDAWGITQNPTLLLFFNIPLYMKFDQGTGATSGMFSIGTTTAANEYGYSQPVTFSAGDQLKLTITKRQGKTFTQLQNITAPSNPIAVGEFNVNLTSTGGQNWLAFLGGQQEFSEFKITSNERNFGGTSGVVVIGDSQTAGVGNSDPAFRWINQLMRGNTNAFVNLGISSWLTGTFSASRVTEFLTGINGKIVIINLGYNDAAQGTAGATYETNLETTATTAQGMGYTVVFVSIVPSYTADTSPYDTQMSTAATNTSSHYISDRTALTVGTTLNPNYSATDQVHINDDGALVMANTIKVVAPDLYSQLMGDFNNTDIRFYNIPFDYSSVSLLGVDHLGKTYRVDPSRYLNRNWTLIQPTLQEIQTGNIGIDGKMQIGNDFYQKNATSQGLRINFNNGVNNTVGSNLTITNVGVAGTGTTPAFPSISGLRNILLQAVSTKAAGFDGGIISGNDNLILHSNFSSTISGSSNTVLNTGSNGVPYTSANLNIAIGKDATKGITTGASALTLITKNTSGQSFASSLSSAIILGEMSSGEAYTTNDVSLNTGQFTATNVWIGGRAGAGSLTYTLNAAGNSNGANTPGATLQIRASRGTGSAEPGTTDFQFSTPTGSSSTLHSAFTSTLLLSRTSMTLGDAINFVLNTTTGTKLGTSTSQKFAHWNATPIVQPVNTVAIDDVLITTGLRASGGNSNFSLKIINNLPQNLKGYTVSTLPTGVTGDVAYVTDALTPTFLTTAIGGGAIVSPVFYNGTNWITY